MPVVVAGLLHAAYASCEFGNGWRGEGSSLYRCVDMAARLGFSGLANALDGAFKEILSADAAAMFRRSETESFRLAPASHGLLLAVRLRRLLALLPLP
jgi:hypothetical protein